MQSYSFLFIDEQCKRLSYTSTKITLPDSLIRSLSIGSFLGFLVFLISRRNTLTTHLVQTRI
jgi:hypothetical protein